MQLVINIDDNFYKRAMVYKGEQFPDNDDLLSALITAVNNGVPLSKGHGDLIDRSQIEYMKAIHDLKWGKITASECATKIKYSAPTIVKADRSEEDG